MKTHVICMCILASLYTMAWKATRADDIAGIDLHQHEHGRDTNTIREQDHLEMMLTGHKHHRHNDKSDRRHERIINNGRKACSTKRRFLSEATNEFGKTVQLAPIIVNEGRVRPQFIYETYCAMENCNCRGVDVKVHESACITNHMMVNARIVKEGKMKWDSIKVGAGCDCIVM